MSQYGGRNIGRLPIGQPLLQLQHRQEGPDGGVGTFEDCSKTVVPLLSKVSPARQTSYWFQQRGSKRTGLLGVFDIQGDSGDCVSLNSALDALFNDSII